MWKRTLIVLVALACPAGAAEWGYVGEDGPAAWAGLSPAYALCAEGKAQSPIDLAGAEPSDHATPKGDYAPSSVRIARQAHVVDILDNGHTIQVSYDRGSTLEHRGEHYELVQYHFHAPSEHTVDGKSFPMEMHLVHQSETGGLAVVGVLLEEGDHNYAYAPVFENLPPEVGESRHLENLRVDIDDLLPGDERYYRYEGSLTTPPCSEGVKWFVFVMRESLSKRQIDAFTAIFRDNHRPVQPRHERELVIVD